MDYILISQDRMHIDHFKRQPDNQWLVSEASTPDTTVRTDSIGCTLSLTDVHDKVPLEEQTHPT